MGHEVSEHPAHRSGISGPWAALLLVSLSVGCAAGNTTPRDSGTSDADAGDTAVMDAMRDQGVDSGTDTGPMVEAGTCEECTEHAQCGAGNFCATLTGGERACVPGCNIDIPDCPRGFNCVLDFTTGVDSAVCLPIGALCCLDEDADEHGQGIGCLGPDCDDDDAERNPAMPELCNGIDDDCDGSPDDPPTDCQSGRCTDDGDGTYTAVSGADCEDAMCVAGTTEDCALFSCADGGEDGDACAASCAPAGTDDDSFCIEAAHCDAGVCVADEDNGNACDEDSDCTAGHCDNGFCCASGVCCSSTSDCPGGGSPTTLCDDARLCEGTRGETTCSAASECETVMGLDDDSACDSSTLALDCAPYDPVYCDGTTDQPPPSCPRSCVADGECVDAAHCELGVCIPDRPAGGSCARQPDCQDGLFCVDGVCCGSACTGTCEACDLPGTAGTCTAVPAMGDPDNECPGFSCAAFYDGFTGGDDACYRRQDISDSQASCSGARSCINPTTACSLQPRGAVQIDCHNTCQSPVPGTCSGTMPGSCLDLDSPGDTVSCGMGECMRTVQRCVNGAPMACIPGAPSTEVCNNLDDDCDGAPDDGPASSLCPVPPGGGSVMCTMGVCSLECSPPNYDLNATYSDGCECMDDTSGDVCGAATDLGGFLPGTSTSRSGTIAPVGESDWYSVSFPNLGRGPANGVPTISLTGANAANFRFDIYASCAAVPGAPLACGMGPSGAGAGSWSFRDNAATAGPTAYSTSSNAWPTTILFRVYSDMPTTNCSAATYQVTISR